MGFALWVDSEMAWAQGRHEYQPMGAAVVARSDLFRERDFRRTRLSPSHHNDSYVGLFASLGDMNAYLERMRLIERAVHKPAK